jgi:hypothetical protein
MASMPMPPMKAAPDSGAPADSAESPDQSPEELANDILTDMHKLAEKAKGDEKLQSLLAGMQSWVDDMSGPADDSGPKPEPMGGIASMEAGGNPNARPM